MLNKNSRYYLIKNQAQPYSVFGKVLPEMKESFGELILRRMNDIGIKSKSELARRVGISAAYAGDLINNTGKTKSGKYQPSQEVISKLAEVLRISQTDILGTLGWITISESYKPSDSLATLVNEFSQLSIEDQWDLSYIIEIFNREINRKQTDKKLLELFQDFINNYEVLEKAGINTDKLNAFLNANYSIKEKDPSEFPQILSEKDFHAIEKQYSSLKEVEGKELATKSNNKIPIGKDKDTAEKAA